MFDTYKKRNELIRAIGYKTYKSYLASAIWSRIRAEVLRRAGHKCFICKCATATQVHHRSYDINTLLGKDLTNLIAVCDQCHELGEFSCSSKVDIDECNNRHHTLKKAEHKRKQSSRNKCFVCGGPVKRVNAKCRDCQRIRS